MDGTFLVYSYTHADLQSKVDTKLGDLCSRVKKWCFRCVVGNKSDQREISGERREDFDHQLGAMFTKTSAASNTGTWHSNPEFKIPYYMDTM